MSEWVNLDVVEGVGPVARKRRRPRDDESLLDHEAAVLAAVDHPGVVRLVERCREPEPALLTHFVGTHTLATAPPMPVDEAIALVAGLAETLVALHRLGIRHGAVEPSHVLIGPGGRPVLCGFSRATTPGTPSEETPTPAEDVAGVGRLMAGLLAGHDDLEPIPHHRSLRPRHWSGYRPRALLSLADHCQADDPASRPSMAGLAATIGDLAEGGGRPRHPRTSTVAGRAAVGGLVVVGLIAVAAAARTWTDRPEGPAVAAAHPAPATAGDGAAATGDPRDRSDTTLSTASPSTDDDARASAPAGTEAQSAEPPSRPPDPVPPATAGPGAAGEDARRACRDRGGEPGADLDGDGCPDGSATVVDHRVLVGEEQFVIGRPGDRVLVGDWDCDGLVTAVLARPDPAAVWHFPTWAPPGGTVPATLVSDTVDPASVSREPGPRSCDRLVGTDARSGRPTRVAVTP